MDRQDVLIEILIQRNIFKLPDGRDLFEGSIEELAGLLKGADKNDKSRSEMVCGAHGKQITGERT
ncbi:Fur-regulated basic protein FbpA [Bacillus mycoides]|nr:Fur-regulated basic protein FbpA [Bacillus mycoides]